MKIFTLSLLFCFSACTQKFADYDLIRKVDFQKESYERPITRMQVLPTGKDHLQTCYNQWLFFSNAEAEKLRAIPVMVRSLCPGEDYLMDAELTETWWTTLVFTRACAEIETKCAAEKKR